MKKELILLKALADETRLEIIKYLLNGKKCVCEIFPHVKRTQSTVSIQLDILRKAGIVNSKKEGKKVYYFICDKKIYSLFKLLGIKNGKPKKFSCFS